MNDAAQAVLGAGGDPSLILCSPGQARVLSNEYKNQLQIVRSDDRRGAYVAVIVNEINGRGMTVMADPDMPDTDSWIIDPAGFGLASLKGRAITDSDATPKGSTASSAWRSGKSLSSSGTPARVSAGSAT